MLFTSPLDPVEDEFSASLFLKSWTFFIGGLASFGGWPEPFWDFFPKAETAVVLDRTDLKSTCSAPAFPLALSTWPVNDAPCFVPPPVVFSKLLKSICAGPVFFLPGVVFGPPLASPPRFWSCPRKSICWGLFDFVFLVRSVPLDEPDGVGARAPLVLGSSCLWLSPGISTSDAHSEAASEDAVKLDNVEDASSVDLHVSFCSVVCSSLDQDTLIKLVTSAAGSSSPSLSSLEACGSDGTAACSTVDLLLDESIPCLAFCFASSENICQALE